MAFGMDSGMDRESDENGLPRELGRGVVFVAPVNGSFWVLMPENAISIQRFDYINDI